MAWARPPGAPQFPSCPLETLEPRENEYTPLTERYLIPVASGAAGIGSVAVYNRYNRRPLYSGIWKYFALGIGMTYLGIVIRDIKHEMAVERDEVLRQYIKLHPEDFPPYKKKLLKDVIEPWTPIR